MKTLAIVSTGLLGALLAACASEPVAGGGSGGETSSGTTSSSSGTTSSSSGTTSSSSGTTSSSSGTTSSSSGTTSSSSSGTHPGPTTMCGGPLNPSMSGSGQTTDRWKFTNVSRNGVNYGLMANGWGPGFSSQEITWNGTSFTVVSMQGSQGQKYEPASYPALFCGAYSDKVSGSCGLPAAISSITTLKTGWIWNPNGNNGQYNAAYDIWVGNGTSVSSHSGFLMVWLRDPLGQRPAGNKVKTGITVPNVAGTWDIWSGTVSGKPCVSYVRTEGQDWLGLDFDVMDFWKDLPKQSLTISATHILSVAIGFEMWNGPITNLETTDFCVKVN